LVKNSFPFPMVSKKNQSKKLVKKPVRKPVTLWVIMKIIAQILFAILVIIGLAAKARHYWNHHLKTKSNAR